MADLTIAHTEEMVGSGHPSKTDTLNRLTLIEHNSDGTHNKLTKVTDPWVDVRAFGVVGDGATDDTTAIQSALNLASSSGVKIVRLSPGTYKIGDVEVPANVTIVDGGGTFKFVLGSTASGLDMQTGSRLMGVRFNVAGADSLGTSAAVDIEGDDVWIIGCVFDGQTAGPSAYKFNYTVRFSNTASNLRTRIEDNDFKNTYFGVVRQSGMTGDASYSKISGNRFFGIDKGDAIEMNISDSDVDMQIHGNIINDVSADGVTNAGIAIGIAGDEGLSGAEGSETRRISIMGNTVNSTVMGIHTEGVNKIKIVGNTVNNVTSGTEAGIQIYGSDDFTISCNQVGDCTTGGIQVQAESTDQSSSGTVSGNDVKDCPTGIHIDTDTANSNVVINGNHVKNSSSKGISVQGGADYNITGNATEDCVLAYRIDAESNANTVVMSGNLSTNDTTDYSFLNIGSTSFKLSGNNFIGDSSPRTTIAADATTQNVSGGNVFITSANSGATAITNFTNARDMQIITVRGGSSTNASTIDDTGNFRLNGAITLNIHTCITLQYDAILAIWIELSRSVN